MSGYGMHSFDWAEIWSKAAGLAGALVSTRFLAGSWQSRLLMAGGGTLVAGFLGPWVTGWLSLPPEAAGFMLGLFGMSVIARIWEWLQTVKVSDFIERWLPASKARPQDPPKDKEPKP